jgi:hypothetical protein
MVDVGITLSHMTHSSLGEGSLWWVKTMAGGLAQERSYVDTIE